MCYPNTKNYGKIERALKERALKERALMIFGHRQSQFSRYPLCKIQHHLQLSNLAISVIDFFLMGFFVIA